MCSVRDVCKMLKTAKSISLVWDGDKHRFNPNDDVQMSSYGDYAVKELEIYNENEVGIVVAFAPIKVG